MAVHITCSSHVRSFTGRSIKITNVSGRIPYSGSRPWPRRAFFSFPGAPTTQHLTATRVLPYPKASLYALIADVDSYSSFVPYCSHSRATRWSEPDAQGRRNPIQADLHVGWGGLSETFTSELRCVPGESVEALGGGDTADVHGNDGQKGNGLSSTVFESLVTRWSLKELDGSDYRPTEPLTQVNLDIKYKFTNPVYAAVSAAVSDQVAGLMIEAFEKRAAEKLGQKPS